MGTSPFCFLFSVFFNQSIPWQIAHSRMGKSHCGPKTSQVVSQSPLPSIAWCVWVGMQTNTAGHQKIPLYLRCFLNCALWWTSSWCLAVLRELATHPLQGPSLRKSFVWLPRYMKGNKSVVCYPSATLVHPWKEDCFVLGKKALCLICKYTCL